MARSSLASANYVMKGFNSLLLGTGLGLGARIGNNQNGIGAGVTIADNTAA